MPKKTGYLFLDVETTGDNPYIDEVWECSHVFDTFVDGNFASTSGLVMEHLKHDMAPSTWVLAHTEYSEWFNAERKQAIIGHQHPVTPKNFLGRMLVELASQNFNELYLVGQNPAFDVCFLEKLRKSFYEREKFPWSYRLLSVGDLLMGFANGYAHVERPTRDPLEAFKMKPAGLRDAYAAILPPKDKDTKPKFHNSAHDVRATREIFYSILDIDVQPVNAVNATERAQGKD